ncbi:major facilitator superfamily domain-containing protein [Phaeosphaeriaceae sp. PMI808]|nr:major facilitator superfamily domain-containing protein [Phaeosphaeriaceae sp. PMI808]
MTTEVEHEPQSERPSSEPEYLSSFRLFLVIGSLCLGIFLHGLDTNIIGVAVPKITTEFNSLNDIAWYGSSYLLTVTAFQPLFGNFYKYFAAKPIYLISIAIFEVGSIICATAQSSTALIPGRSVLGLGAAGLLQGALAIIRYVLGGYKIAWNSSKAIGLLVGFVVLMVVFCILQLRRGKYATIPLRVMKQRSIYTGALVLFFLGLSSLTSIQGVSATDSGVRFISMVGPQIVLLVVIGATVSKVGFHVPFIIFGIIIDCTGAGLITTMELPYTALYAVLDPLVATGNAIAVFSYQLGGALQSMRVIEAPGNTFCCSLFFLHERFADIGKIVDKRDPLSFLTMNLLMRVCRHIAHQHLIRESLVFPHEIIESIVVHDLSLLKPDNSITLAEYVKLVGSDDPAFIFHETADCMVENMLSNLCI